MSNGPQVQGLKSLERKLTRTLLEKSIQHTRQAMEKSADEIVKVMKQLVPKGESGEAERSIGWTWGDAPDGTMGLMSGGDGKGLKITIYAGGGTAFYARFLEFGTKNMGAQPFFFPAYRMNKKRAANRTKRAIKKGLKEASAS